MKKKHPILVIGVGLNGPDSLCRDMQDRVRQADLLVGGSKILRGFRDFSGRKVAIEGHLKGLDRTIRHAMSKGRRVAVLSSGDPNFFGVVRYLLTSFRPDEMEIHPNVSAMQLAFARIGVPWDDAAFVSAHGRDLGPVVHAVRTGPKVAILTDPRNHPGRISKALMQAGVPDARTFVCSRLGGPDEKVWEGRLSSLAGKRFPLLNVMVVLGEADRAGGFGIPDGEFSHEGGMITRSEVRAVTLSKLGIRPGNILWDIGAGSGSVSIEASRLAGGVTVYAVEKSRRTVSHLKQNIRRLGSGKIYPVSGEAPSALKGLPNPDRVFVGGSGGNLTSIVSTSVRRLRPGGRIVINAVTLETLHQARTSLKKRELCCEVVSLQVGRGRDLKGRVMLKAENQVFIITAEKR